MDLKQRSIEELVPKQYHEFLPLFKQVLTDWLHSHRPGFDHDVWLEEQEIPPRGPLYKMSSDELLDMKEWLEENMIKGFIRQSFSPVTTTCIFSKKPYERLRFYVGY